MLQQNRTNAPNCPFDIEGRHSCLLVSRLLPTSTLSSNVNKAADNFMIHYILYKNEIVVLKDFNFNFTDTNERSVLETRVDVNLLS